jgi:hypothetical protein
MFRARVASEQRLKEAEEARTRAVEDFKRKVSCNPRGTSHVLCVYVRVCERERERERERESVCVFVCVSV